MSERETMTADQLRSIVEGVPDGAEPQWEHEGYRYFVRFKHDQWNIETLFGQCIFGCSVPMAVMLWEASMTAWLVEKMKGVTIGEKRAGGYGVVDIWAVPHVKTSGPTRVHALADACRAYVNGGGE